MMKSLTRIHQSAHQLNVPLLLMLGEQDFICDTEKALNFSLAYGGDVTLNRYPMLYHDLFSEPEKQTVCQDLTAWLTEQFSTSSP